MENRIVFTNEQIQLIKTQIAPKATNDELKLFLYQAERTGLDPLARQIYCIHRKSSGAEKMTIQTSIDGFRVVAERSGDYGGQSEPEWVNDPITGWPVKCKVIVYRFRNDIRYEASVGVAFWNEYCQTKDEYVNGQKTNRKIPGDMWAKMPHTMLAKCAEAVALRKAYPQDLSGLYTTEEMSQADNEESNQQQAPAQPQQQQPVLPPAPVGSQYNASAQPAAQQQAPPPQQQPQQGAPAAAQNGNSQAAPTQSPDPTAYRNGLTAAIKGATDNNTLDGLYKSNKAFIDNDETMLKLCKLQREKIANNGKYILTDDLFKQVHARIMKGDILAFENCDKNYVMNDRQRVDLGHFHNDLMQLEEALKHKYEKEEDILNLLQYCRCERQLIKLAQNNGMIVGRSAGLKSKIDARLSEVKK